MPPQVVSSGYGPDNLFFIFFLDAVVSGNQVMTKHLVDKHIGEVLKRAGKPTESISF